MQKRINFSEMNSDIKMDVAWNHIENAVLERDFLLLQKYFYWLYGLVKKNSKNIEF